MNVSGNGVGVGVGASGGEATVGGGGETVGDGMGVSLAGGFGPGQPVRRQAKMGATQTRIPNCGGESVRM